MIYRRAVKQARQDRRVKGESWIGSDQTAVDTQSLITKICRGTNDFVFCNNVFEKHLYTPTTDIKGLTQIAITQTTIYATNTRIFISKAIAAEKNKELQNLYRICLTGYELLLGQFVDANLNFAKGDYRSMLFNIGKCERFVSDCQNVLGGSRAPPQLGTQNNQNRVLVQMSRLSGELIGK
ncbi:hypothetical protein DH2020_013443 [Rehmannia glutinosa]|uniref:Pectinesterase inhibitor domain-containing protein n=1 Tax=Rehmannia glutinosa TaxID=99300 RepID=A0ABR0X303_REHGL